MSTLSLSFILFGGCKSNKKEQHLKNLGTALFRRSYAGHENWSATEVDSVKRSNPTFDETLKNSSLSLLPYLKTLNYLVKDELLVSKLEDSLQDTINFINKDGNRYLIFMDYSPLVEIRSLKIKGDNFIDSIKLHKTAEKVGLRLAYLDSNEVSVVILFNNYYFMNGDMYEVTLFKID